MARKVNGTFDAFAGTASNLYKLSGTTFSSVGSGYAVPTDELWSYAQFGSNLVATNFADGPQVFDIEAGSSFSALGGSPPTARIADVIEDYLVLASLGSDPFGIAWSDTNDITNWSTGNSGAQTFPDGGRVQNFSGAAGLVVQETTIRRMISAPGSSVVFQFEKIEQAKGTIAPFSVIKYGPSIAHLTEDGFWFNGEPIGKGKVDNYFLAQVDRTRLFSVQGAFDPIRPIFYWLYRTSDSLLYDKGLMYNWYAKKWAEIDVDVYIASNIATPGITLEQLGAAYPNLENVPYSLDSRVWQGGQPVFGVIDSALKLSFFEGETLEATMETGERQIVPGRRALVTGVRPMVDTADAVARIGAREREADTRSWDAAEMAMQTSAWCRGRSGGRYHRTRVRIPAGSSWTHATGVEIEAQAQGGR